MEYYSHRDPQYKSIISILDSFSSDFFDGITMIMRPVVGGIDYMRSMHKSYLVEKEIEKISRLDFDKRELLLDILTDLVASDVYDASFKTKLEVKISKLEEFKDVFEQLGKITNKLNSNQINDILRISLNKLKGKMSSVRENTNLRMWDKGENVNQLMVLDQILHLLEELISETLRKRNYKILDVIIFSLLKIEAFHRNKITFEAFQQYISELSLYGYKDEPLPRNYDVILETLTI
jgi:hypothetical protein